MVKNFSPADKEAVARAVAEAEQKTCAELAVIVAPASDAYQDIMLLFGFIAGSAIGLGLWITSAVVAFPFLLAIQLSAMGLLAFVPWVRHACLRFVPLRIRRHRAAHRAGEEYLTVSRHVSAATPIVLIYISSAERYVHVLTSRSVLEKIPEDEWNVLVRALTAGVSSDGLRNACVKAIRNAIQLLAEPFPA
jgi:putative membrane protein